MTNETKHIITDEEQVKNLEEFRVEARRCIDNCDTFILFAGKDAKHEHHGSVACAIGKAPKLLSMAIAGLLNNKEMLELLTAATKIAHSIIEAETENRTSDNEFDNIGVTTIKLDKGSETLQ